MPSDIIIFMKQAVGISACAKVANIIHNIDKRKVGCHILIVMSVM